MKGSLYSCLLIVRLSSGSRTLILHFETIKTQLNNFQVFTVNFQHNESYLSLAYLPQGHCWCSWPSWYPRYSGTEGGEGQQGCTWTPRTSRTCCMLYLTYVTHFTYGTHLTHVTHFTHVTPHICHTLHIWYTPHICHSSEGKTPVTMVMATKVYYICLFCRDPKAARECVGTRDRLVHL